MADVLDTVLTEEEKKKKALDAAAVRTASDLFKNPIAPSGSPEQARAFEALYPTGIVAKTLGSPDFKGDATGSLLDGYSSEGAPSIGKAALRAVGAPAVAAFKLGEKYADNNKPVQYDASGIPVEPPTGALPVQPVNTPPAGALPPSMPAPAAGLGAVADRFIEGFTKDAGGVWRNNPQADKTQELLRGGFYMDAAGVVRNDKPGLSAAVKDTATPATLDEIARAKTQAPVKPKDGYALDTEWQKQRKDWIDAGSPERGSVEYNLWQRQRAFEASGDTSALTKGLPTAPEARQSISDWLGTIVRGQNASRVALDNAQAIKESATPEETGPMTVNPVMLNGKIVGLRHKGDKTTHWLGANEIDALNSSGSGTSGYVPASEVQKKSAPMADESVTDPAVLVNRVRAENPNWTREQVIAEAKRRAGRG